jgi:raffinose/stachyose/melibiose transport system permease protein
VNTNRVLQNALAAAIAATFALPLYLAFVNVFKTQQQILYHPMDLPGPFTLDNLWQVISRPDQLLLRSLGTSIVITVVSVVGIVFLASITGYYISRQNTRITQGLQVLFLAGLLVPPQVTLIPIVRVFKALGLMGTFQGVALFFIGGGLLSFAIFVYVGFVKNIPRELEEAATIDGADEFRLFWQIIFPLMRPATATVTIFLSLWTWNEFLIPLLILGPARGMTITTGIYIAVGQSSSVDYGQMFAMMFLSALPMLIFFFALQKEFIAGLTAGSLKG